MKEIKVLNIAQPNAHNVIFNGKNIENRSKPSQFRGTIAIYASKTLNKKYFDNQSFKEVLQKECSFGCIIGFVDIVDCITEDKVTSKTKKWFAGPYGYVFENVRILKRPVEVYPPKGAIIWWNLKGEGLEECIKQIKKSSIIPLLMAKEKTKYDLKKKYLPKALVEIVGPKQSSLKQMANGIIQYAEDNGLIYSENKDGENVFFILSNKKLKSLLGVNKIFPNELLDLVAGKVL